MKTYLTCEIETENVLIRKHFPELNLMIEVPRSFNMPASLNITLAMILQRASFACINEHLNDSIKLGLKRSLPYGSRLPLTVVITEELYKKIFILATEKETSIDILCEEHLRRLVE